MNIEDILGINLKNSIDHEVLMNMFKEVGMSKEEMQDFSDNFWDRTENTLYRDLNNMKDSDIHNVKGE